RSSRRPLLRGPMLALIAKQPVREGIPNQKTLAPPLPRGDRGELGVLLRLDRERDHLQHLPPLHRRLLRAPHSPAAAPRQRRSVQAAARVFSVDGTLFLRRKRGPARATGRPQLYCDPTLRYRVASAGERPPAPESDGRSFF